MKKQTILECGLPLCPIKKSKKINDVGMSFLACNKCKILRIPPKELLYFNVPTDQINNNGLIMSILFEMRMWWLKKELPILDNKGINILDVGCGDGQFIAFLKKKMFTNVIGIEPDIDRARNARQKKIPVYSDINDYKAINFLKKGVDVMFLWHVLEHIEQPIYFVKSLVKYLPKNGLLLISVPNHLSIQTRLFGYYSSFPDYGRHIWYHNKDYVNFLEKILPSYNIQFINDKNYEYEIFSWIDSFVSFLARDQNFIHKSLKKGQAGKCKKLLALFMSFFLLPIALLFSLISLLTKNGSTLTFAIRKR